MRRFLIAVGLIFIAGVGVWYVFTHQNSTPQAALPSNVVIMTEYSSTSTPSYSVDVQYPQFGIPAIDTQIKKDVDDAITEIESYPANPRDMASPQNELTIRYESPYIGPDVVSVRLIISEYTGGAHPNTLISGLNFDRATGKQLLQNDAFATIGMTVDQVSASSTAQLKQKLGDAMFPEGANTNPENFSSFQIATNTVTFIFQPYQVAAYAAGAQEVVFARVR
jgi:hypothetical protein